MKEEEVHPFLDFALMGEEEQQDVKPFFAAARAQRAAKEERSPSIGDVVHFKASAIECWAAVVTATDPFSDGVWLSCFRPGETSVHPIRDVPHDEAQQEAATWHWGHE